MKYSISKLGNIIKDKSVIVPMDDTSELYLEYVDYLKNNGTVEETDDLLDEEKDIISKASIVERYGRYEVDGKEAYQLFRADLVNDIYKGLITEVQAFYIEEYLSKGYDKISSNGDWKTAKFKLNSIKLDPSHSFVQPYLNKALDVITEYILNNYE